MLMISIEKLNLLIFEKQARRQNKGIQGYLEDIISVVPLGSILSPIA